MGKEVNHVTFRNSNLFCHNCGKSQDLKMPVSITVMVENIDSFSAAHKDCEKTWVQPEADLNTSIEDRMRWWMEHGERGSSSLFLFATIGRIYDRSIADHVKHNSQHPCDPDDFRRCYLLLKALPEWKSQLYRAKRGSVHWNSLIEHWDELTEMFERQDPKMYERMQQLTNNQ